MNKKIVKEILSYAIVIVLALLVKQFVFTLIIVNGDSMYPTLEDNDIMILDKFSYYFSDIERFDIIVIDYNDNYIIKGSIGAGRATKSPWIAILDKQITSSTRNGVYIVFVFCLFIVPPTLIFTFVYTYSIQCYPH